MRYYTSDGMVDLDMEPCPFCGATPRYKVSRGGYEYAEFDHGDSCFLSYTGPQSDAVGGLLAHAWNSRVPRGECTMEMLFAEDMLEHECREYIMHCESCHHDFGYVLYNEDGNTWMNEFPEYCPSCGARVMDADVH